MPKVSVIIPVYNTEKYLSRCLDSIVNQTLTDIEIICINDCSTDGSLAIIKNYAQKDKRIKIINLPQNSGAGRARNIGIENAQGEYIGFIDSDDFIDLDFYEKLYNKAKETDADVAKGKLLCLKNGETDIDREACFDINRLICENKAYFFHSFTSGIYLKKLLLENKIFFPPFYNFEDPHFSIQIATKLKKISIENDAKYYYDYNFSSTTKTITETTYVDFIKSAKNILNIINNEENDFKRIVYAYILKQAQGYCFSCMVSEKINKMMLDFYVKLYMEYPEKESLIKESLKQQRVITESQILRHARKKLRNEELNSVK